MFPKRFQGWVGLILAGWVVFYGRPAAAARVSWVVDGDTLEVNHRGRRVLVRLMGVDCPESRSSSKLTRQARRTGVSARLIRRWGQRATGFTRRLAAGRRVRLRFDRIGDRRDRYQRLLAYVVLPDGRVLNTELVRRGYAVAYRRYRYTKKRYYLRLERQARAARRGLWADRRWRRFADQVSSRYRPRRRRRMRW
ncbi:MAG: thermonuclease family protein [Proteobacteria bacterium]|nr:thermonuclease family protein [Pseudomonadota bacterium]MBU1741292.1 thermonuclease family protein [Pseudomonadota bacterium]